MVRYSLRMAKIEVIDISGDAGIKVRGSNISELFVNAAIGMYSLITDIEGISERRTIDISCEGESLEGLLVSWLNELIFNFDAHGFIGRKIVIVEINEEPSGGGHVIKGQVSGEEFDQVRHEGKLLLKAATYHNLKVEKQGDEWESEIIFDI